MSSEDKQAKFIRRLLKPGSGYTAFVLVQCLSSRGESLLRKFEIETESVYEEGRIAELAAEVMSTATDDADGHLGLSSYCLYGLKGVTKVERGPVFRLRSQNEDGLDSLEDTEPATAQGVTAQLMRHLESMARTNIQKDEIYARSTTEIIRSQNERLKHYEDAHWETVLRAEELASERDAREIFRVKEIAKDKRMDEAIKTFKPLVPLLLSKFTGAAHIKPELQMEALKALMSNITPETMEQIANIIGPNSLALAEIYMETHQEQPEDGESKPDESPTH